MAINWKEHDRKRKEADKKHRDFLETAVVVSSDVFVDDTTEDMDKTETVERQVEGQLAVDVRKRVQAPEDAAVLVTEVKEDYWMSDVTSSSDYRMTVKCNGVEKSFQTYSAQENFRKLLEWLDEAPATEEG